MDAGVDGAATMRRLQPIDAGCLHIARYAPSLSLD